MAIEIRSDFSGGRLKGWKERSGDIHLDIDTLETPAGPAPWFYFLISGVRGQTLSFHAPAIDASRAPIAVSYDRFHWLPVTEVVEGGFRHHFREDDAIISLTPPYTPGMLYEFTLWARRSPHARIEYLDKVYGVTAVTISEFDQPEGRPVIWITAGAFPLGAAASWVAEGIARFLISTDPVARRLRQRHTFKILPVPNPGGTPDASAEQLITDAIAADRETGETIAALVSLDGRTYDDGDWLALGSGRTEAGVSPSESTSLNLATYLPWYQENQTFDSQAWPAPFARAQRPDTEDRAQINTGWFYPAHLVGQGRARKSQFDLLQEGELLCRALDFAFDPDGDRGEIDALPALVAPSLRRVGQEGVVSLWLAAERPAILSECVVSVVGDGFKVPLRPQDESTEESGRLRGYAGTVDAEQIEGVLSVSVERSGAIREMPLAERSSRPSDMSLY